MDKDCFKTPPNMVNSNSNTQGLPKNNLNKIPMSSSSSSPQTQTSATARKRIINKIPLDFNKLKQAGLDRKLAEALRQQNLSSAKKIASATTTTMSSSASASSPASSTNLPSDSTSLSQAQRQPARQTAVLPIINKEDSNSVAAGDIKALLKKKILNKMAKTPEATTTTTTTTTTPPPLVPIASLRPIPKANLTRPKVLLNTVNQLPKHRARCGVSSPQLSQLPRSRQQKAEPAAPSKPLIVLENKVLAPNEKIDVSALCLPKIHASEVKSVAGPVTAIDTPEMPEKPAEKLKSTSRIFQLTPTAPGSVAKKVILNANKLKVTREQRAQMAKDIRKQAMEKAQQPVMKSIEDDSSNITVISPTTNIETSLISPSLQTSNIQTSLLTLPNHKSTSEKNSSSNIIDKVESEVSESSDPLNNVTSAVDFIAQLKCNSSLDLNLQLSAEEMSMNALFGGCETVLPTPDNNKDEEELPIGKILQMEDMDILHATMNVDENESNVLCISPNAITLQKSIQIEEAPIAKETESKPRTTLEPFSAKDNLSLVTAPTLVITAPQEEAKNKAPLPLSFRPKKGKINLVQRTKKTSQGNLKNIEGTVNKSDKQIDLVISQEKDNNISDELEDVEKKHTNIQTTSVDKGGNAEEKQEKEEENKIENNISKVTEIQEKVDIGFNKSTYKEHNAETLSSDKKSNLITILDTDVTEDDKNNETVSSNQAEKINSKFNEHTDNKDTNYEVLKKRRKTSLDTNLKSNANVDSKISETNSSKEVEIHNEEILAKKSKDNCTEVVLSKETELVLNKSIISSKSEPGKELKASEESITETESVEVPLNSTMERDLTQFYHPPKMPKLNQKSKNNNELISSNDTPTATQTSVSLLEVLSQKEPSPQGEAQLPFRQDLKQKVSEEKSQLEVTGIQNLLDKLANENVVPTRKEVNGTKTEEQVKAPRKKLVKTRPVLGGKRTRKVALTKTEALHPRKRALLAESQMNGAHRVPTSSTSDDDGDMFHGFNDNEASNSKTVTNLQNNGTDISDDATPDYDETEEDPQPEEISPKTDPFLTGKKIEIITEPIVIEIEDEREPEISKEPAQVEEPTEVQNNSNLVNPETTVVNKKRGRSLKMTEPVTTMEPAQVDETTEIPINDILKNIEPTVVTKKRGRPLKSLNKKPEESLDKTEEVAQTRKRRRQSKDISKELTESEITKDLAAVEQDSLSVTEVTPVAKRSRKAKSQSKDRELTESETTIDLSVVQQDTLSVTLETPVAKRSRKKQPQNDTPLSELIAKPETNSAKRRVRQKNITASDATATPDTEIKPIPDPKVTSTPDDKFTPKRRGRKPKFFDLLTKKVKTEDSAENAEESEEKANGPNNWPQTPDFNLRLLLIRNRDQLESDEELREDGRGTGSEQCGLCLVRCEEQDWMKHLSEHYGIGWRIQKTPAMITRGILITMLTSYVKEGNRLICRLCGRSLGSGLGMMLHLEGCGMKQNRVECESCKNSYTKSSIEKHYRTCYKRLESTEDSIEATVDKTDNTPVYSNAGRAKRRSTIKAETKLQKIAAQLKNPETEVVVNADESDYDMGADKESSEEYESEGVDSNEEADQSNDDNKSLSAEDPELTKSKKKKKGGQKATVPKCLASKITKSGVTSADSWQYFLKTNYTQDTLYPHLLPLYEQLLPGDAIKLLPSRESTSMRYAYDNKNENAWMSLAPLESFNKKNEHVCHLGRPVKELAWVPLPSTVDSQYLLCSQRSKMLRFTRQFKEKQEDDLLLLLECKAAKNSNWSLQTRLHYGIHVTQGPVLTFAFMPSGGYDESANRLALLAVGSVASVVIYALPLELPKSAGQKDAVVVLEALRTLSLDVDNPVRDPCTKICWSQAAGHKLIVTGYASGNVAFWDVADEDGFNCVDRNNQRHFLPASFFYFGERNIQTLELHYDANGPHWLAVGASVRKFWMYDISNLSQPLAILGDVIHYLYLGCISWSPLWESLLIGFNEMTRAQFTRLISLSPVDISLIPITLDVMLNTIRSMHFNCDQLLLASVSDNGDLIIAKKNEFISQTKARRNKTTGPLSSTEACYLSDVPEPNFVTPDIFKRDYGLVLRPLKSGQPKDKSASYQDPKRQPHFSVRNMLHLNCVRWNWNSPASSWLAVGAEHGLLRIMNYDPKDH